MAFIAAPPAITRAHRRFSAVGLICIGTSRNHSRPVSDSSSEWTEFKKSMLGAHLDAFRDAKFELSRRILTISSVAIGLLVTLALNLDDPPCWVKAVFAFDLVAFVGAVIATMKSLRVDPDYLTKAIEEIHEQESSEELEDLNDVTKWWEDLGYYSFFTGIVLLLVLGIAAIF